MTLPSGAWHQIAAGSPPTSSRVQKVAAEDGVLLGALGVESRQRQLAARVLGAGPLDRLLADADVTDVLVNAAHGVWADRSDGLRRVPCDVGDEADVRRLAVRLAGLCGRRLDDTSPYVDGVLPGGVRLHAVLPPLAEGVHISLRVPRRTAPTVLALSEAGAFPPSWVPLMDALILRRRSFLVSGGTGSGKTTLLGALLAQVPADERIVLVEDVRELAVDHPHVVRLQTRAANVEGRGEVPLPTLVRQSLRMRPDRLVVGEVRGAEVRELLTALNTGHEGGCGTVHANTAADVVSRFEALGALASMSREAVHAQLFSAVQVVVHLRRLASLRSVETVSVLQRDAGGQVQVVCAVELAGGRSLPGPGWGQLASSLGLPAGHWDAPCC